MSSDEAIMSQGSHDGKTFLGPSFRFGGPSALVTFDGCRSEQVNLTFDGDGEGVFIFENCNWINSNLTFLGEENFYSFEKCTFNYSILIGGPDLIEAEADAEENGTAVLQGEQGSFVFRACTFVGSRTMAIDSNAKFPENGQDFSSQDQDLESDSITFSNCTFAFVGNPKQAAGVGDSQAEGQESTTKNANVGQGAGDTSNSAAAGDPRAQFEFYK